MRRILPILLLAAVAACSKNKDPDRPVQAGRLSGDREDPEGLD